MIEIRIPTRDVVAAALKGGPEHRFIELCNGLIARTDETKYPGGTFFFRDKTLMIAVDQNKDVWFKFKDVWTEIEESMGETEHEEVQEFFEGMVKKYFVIVEPLNFDAGFIYTTGPDEKVGVIESHFGPGRVEARLNPGFVGVFIQDDWWGSSIQDHFTKSES